MTSRGRRPPLRPILAVIVVAAGTAAACWSARRSAGIPFAPYGDDYRTKMDFARLERRYPLTRAQLASLDPETLGRLDQEQIDQVYARLTAGPVPDGAFEETFFFANGGGLPRIAEVLGGLKGRVFTVEEELIRRLGSALWKGKVFYRRERLLRNMIQDRLAADLLFKKLDVDPGRLQQTRVRGRDVWLLLPARVYCGQSLFDGRRESIVADYAFGDEIPGYQEPIDRLAGRNGAQIRDELRMVHPGLYLGRAYLSRAFVLNFTLRNAEVEAAGREAFRLTGRIEEDCRVGTQRVVATARATAGASD